MLIKTERQKVKLVQSRKDSTLTNVLAKKLTPTSNMEDVTKPFWATSTVPKPAASAEAHANTQLQQNVKPLTTPQPGAAPVTAVTMARTSTTNPSTTPCKQPTFHRLPTTSPSLLSRFTRIPVASPPPPCTTPLTTYHNHTTPGALAIFCVRCCSSTNSGDKEKSIRMRVLGQFRE